VIKPAKRRESGLAKRSLRRLLPWMLLAGLGFGAATSVLNQFPILGSVAAVVGSGAGWGAIGVAAAMVLGVRCPAASWLPRAAVVAAFYVGACLTYYVSDWLFSIPGTLMLREDVRSGAVPDPGVPGGLDLVPDLGEWVLWSTVSVPAALLVSGIATVLLRYSKSPRAKSPSTHS